MKKIKMVMEVWWRAEGFGQLRGKRKGVRGFRVAACFWFSGFGQKRGRLIST